MVNKPIYKKDLDEFGKGLKKDILSTIDAKLEYEITKLKNELGDEQKKFLSDLHNTINGLVTEVKDNQEFRDTISFQVNENTEKIIKLEKKVFGVASTY